MNSIYGSCEAYLPTILQTFIQDIEEAAANYKKETNLKLYEHLHARIKTEKSMREKCQRKGLPQTSQSALKEIRDAIGVRIITGFTDDIYRIVEYIRQMKYKKNIQNPERITRELKRCADELASCDLTMQTIRDLIQRSDQD